MYRERGRVYTFSPRSVLSAISAPSIRRTTFASSELSASNSPECTLSRMASSPRAVSRIVASRSLFRRFNRHPRSQNASRASSNATPKSLGSSCLHLEGNRRETLIAFAEFVTLPELAKWTRNAFCRACFCFLSHVGRELVGTQERFKTVIPIHPKPFSPHTSRANRPNAQQTARDRLSMQVPNVDRPVVRGSMRNSQARSTAG